MDDPLERDTERNTEITPLDESKANDDDEMDEDESEQVLQTTPVEDYSKEVSAHDETVKKPPPSGLRLCFRSTVMPQKSSRTPKERHRVIILQGPNKGQTGAELWYNEAMFRFSKRFILCRFLTLICCLQVLSHPRSTASGPSWI